MLLFAFSVLLVSSCPFPRPSPPLRSLRNIPVIPAKLSLNICLSGSNIYICRSSSSNLLWIDENMFLILVDRLIGSVDTRTVQWIYLFEKWTSIEFIFLIWSCIRNNRDIDGNGNFNVAFSIKLVLNWVLFWWKRIIEIRNFWSKSSINFENCK